MVYIIQYEERGVANLHVIDEDGDDNNEFPEEVVRQEDDVPPVSRLLIVFRPIPGGGVVLFSGTGNLHLATDYARLAHLQSPDGLLRNGLLQRW